MPRSFPNMESLTSNAQLRNFRQPHDGESEVDYRAALAQHVQDLGDIVEAMEIRSGQGWNAWDLNQTEALLTQALPEIGGLLAEARQEQQRRYDATIDRLGTASPEETKAILDDLLGERPPCDELEDFVVSSHTGETVRVPMNERVARYTILFSAIGVQHKVYADFINEAEFQRRSFPLFEADVDTDYEGTVFTCEHILSPSDVLESSTHTPLSLAEKALPRGLLQYARAVVVHIDKCNKVLKNTTHLRDGQIDLMAEYAQRKAATSTEMPVLGTSIQAREELLDKLFDSINPPSYSASDYPGRPNRNVVQYIFVFNETYRLRAEPIVREMVDKHSFLMFDADDQQGVFGRVLRYNRKLTREMVAAWEDETEKMTLLRLWCNLRLRYPASFVMAELNGKQLVIKNNILSNPSHIRKTADYALTREACPILPLA